MLSNTSWHQKVVANSGREQHLVELTFGVQCKLAVSTVDIQHYLMSPDIKTSSTVLLIHDFHLN